MDRTVTGTVVFSQHERYFFGPGLGSLQMPLLLQLQEKGAPSRDFRDAPESEVSSWRPEGWTAQDEAKFKQWSEATKRGVK